MPLFCDDAGLPFTRAQLDRALDVCLRSVLHVETSSNYSWHSYRVTLACLLDSQGVPHDKIKKMLRWVSDEALQTYVRPNDETMAAYMDKVLRGRVSSVQARGLPHVLDPAPHLEMVHRLVVPR